MTVLEMDLRDDEWVDHHVPVDLIELYEVLEWEGIVEPPTLREPLTIVPRTMIALPEGWVPRSAWGARRPKYFSGDITDTARGNTCHYEGPRMGVFPHSSCATKVRGIQAFHMDDRGWADVAYHTIVCPHGFIFECRSYGTRGGANGTNLGNESAYAHCALIGVGDTATADLKVGLTRARLYFEARGAGHRRWGHRDWKPTACPGDPLYRFVQEGWNAAGASTPAPTPSTEPLTLEDDMAEIIKTMYRMVRGKDYDVAREDPRGFLHWMGRSLRDPNPLDFINGNLAPALEAEARSAGKSVDIPIV